MRNMTWLCFDVVYSLGKAQGERTSTSLLTNPQEIGAYELYIYNSNLTCEHCHIVLQEIWRGEGKLEPSFACTSRQKKIP